jgi:hypothetical protein
MSMVDPWEVSELKIREHPPSTVRNINDGHREVSELEVRERPPSMLRNIHSGPSGGARAGAPGAPSINAKKR